MSDFAASRFTAGQLNAIVKLLQKQGGPEGVERFLRGELVSYTAERLNAIIELLKKQGGPEGVERFLHGELVVMPPSPRAWREEDGVIYFSVTSDGTTGEQWIERLEAKGFLVVDYAKQVLRSSDFIPTNGMTTQVAVLKGMLFEDDDRTTGNIRAEADQRRLGKPNPEVACLIREKFSDVDIEAMGLCYVVAMHESVADSEGDPDLLGANRNGGGRWLDAFFGGPDDGWNRDDGFAFVCGAHLAPKS